MLVAFSRGLYVNFSSLDAKSRCSAMRSALDTKIVQFRGLERKKKKTKKKKKKEERRKKKR